MVSRRGRFSARRLGVHVRADRLARRSWRAAGSRVSGDRACQDARPRAAARSCAGQCEIHRQADQSRYPGAGKPGRWRQHRRRAARQNPAAGYAKGASELGNCRRDPARRKAGAADQGADDTNEGGASCSRDAGTGAGADARRGGRETRPSLRDRADAKDAGSHASRSADCQRARRQSEASKAEAPWGERRRVSLCALCGGLAAQGRARRQFELPRGGAGAEALRQPDSDGGSVERVVIDRTSGRKVLDAAAIKIVEMAAPYAPFPPDIRRDTDVLDITRTWTFEKGGELRSE